MHAGSRVYKGQITFLFYTKILRQKNERQDYARLLAANEYKIAEWPMPYLYNLHPWLIVLVFLEALPFVMKKMAPRKKVYLFVTKRDKRCV